MRKEERAYCQVCDDDVSFVIKEVERSATIRGITFSYIYKEARCSKCGELVYPVSLGKENSISMFDKYKEIEGLLTSKEIIQIRKDNKLTQKALAKKIGCGEKNIARYENGAIQNRSIDNSIRNIGKKKERVSYMVYYINNNIESSSFINDIQPIYWKNKEMTINYSSENKKKCNSGGKKWNKNFTWNRTTSLRYQ